MLGKTCYLTSSHISLQASHLKLGGDCLTFMSPHILWPPSLTHFSALTLFFYSDTHSLSHLLSDAILDRVTWAPRLQMEREKKWGSEVEERSDVTSQRCWQHVLCSALANTMPKKREIRPRSSKQLPKHPRHESWGETAGGIQSAGPSIQSSSFHYAPTRPQRCTSQTSSNTLQCEHTWRNRKRVEKTSIW